MTCTAESGTCRTCVSACLRKPGWFLPGQVEQVAVYLGISLAELFRTRLAVDYWYADDRLSPTTFVLSPACGEVEPGAVAPLTVGGRCTFLTDEGRCEIHPVKPMECAQWYCGQDEVPVAHVDVARQWHAHQDEITAVLGVEPELPPVSILDMLDFTMGLIDRSDPVGAHDEGWSELRDAVREAKRKH